MKRYFVYCHNDPVLILIFGSQNEVFGNLHTAVGLDTNFVGKGTSHMNKAVTLMTLLGLNARNISDQIVVSFV